MAEEAAKNDEPATTNETENGAKAKEDANGDKVVVMTAVHVPKKPPVMPPTALVAGAKPATSEDAKKPEGGLSEEAKQKALDNLCWDIRTRGFCPRGLLCKWQHTLPGGMTVPAVLDKGQKIVQEITGGPAVAWEEVEGLTMDRPDEEDPPQHLAGAIAGSVRMKRLLEGQVEELSANVATMPDNEPGPGIVPGLVPGIMSLGRLIPAPGQLVLSQPNGSSQSSQLPASKRRRLIVIDSQSLSNWDGEDDGDMSLLPEEQEKKDKVDQLMKKWGLDPQGDRGTRFVLETTAYMSEVDKLLESPFKPEKHAAMADSTADQVNSRIIEMRVMGGPPTGPCEAIKTFCFKWGIENDEVPALKKLPFTELRYVMENYDGMCGFEELAAEAREEEEKQREEKKIVQIPPELPGETSIMRSQRLELIDPCLDALVLGDANLSFSMLLANHRVNMGHTGRVVATTFEDLATLKLRYKELARTIKVLLSNYAEVWHGVDCTRLAADPRFQGHEESFGAVYYNFPHAGAVRGFFDKHPFVHWRHSNLLAMFFRAIRYFVKPGAFVKVASNANAKGCRAVDIIIAAERSEFMHVGTFPFTEWILRRYHRSFGDKRDERSRPDGDAYKAQQAAADMVYCFRYAPSGEELPNVPIKQPPLIEDFMDSVVFCSCGYVCQKELKDTPGAEFHFKPSGSHMLLPPKKKAEACLKLYKRFLSEASGVHVG